MDSVVERLGEHTSGIVQSLAHVILKWNLPSGLSTEDMAGLVASEASQGIRDLDVYRQGPFGLGMLALVVLEGHIEYWAAACTAVGIPKSVAEAPNTVCTGVVNQSCPNHHVVVC
jgi:hypothetical protein